MNKCSLPFIIMALLLLLGAGRIGATHAQVAAWPVTLTMTGPTTAVAGQEISYRVHYRLTDPSRRARGGFRIPIPQNTTYVSTRVVSGPARTLAHLDERFVYWGSLDESEETDGAVELIVKIDAEYVGSIFGWAYVPGTETTNSNFVETQVFAPGTMPEAGGGDPVAGSGLRVAPALLALALAGAALLCAGAATRVMRRPS